MIEKQFTETDLEAAADFAFAVNSEPAYGSTFCSNLRKNIYEDFSESAKNGCLAVYREGGAIFGAANCFPDEAKNRADVNLLIAREAEADYRKIAEELLAALRERMGEKVKFVFYFPIQNQNLAAFLNSWSAKKEENEYGLILIRGAEKNLAECDGEISDLQPSDSEEFAVLHDTIFPDIYVSGNDIIQNKDSNRRVFVIRTDGVLSAYGVLSKKSGARWNIEVIAVRDDCRRKGLGRRMLSHMITHAFETPGVEKLDLIVDCGNESAKKLYFDVGFTVEFENCCYIL